MRIAFVFYEFWQFNILFRSEMKGSFLDQNLGRYTLFVVGGIFPASSHFKMFWELRQTLNDADGN